MARWNLRWMAISVFTLTATLATAFQALDDSTSMSPGARRMHARLIELSEGEASMESLRIEFMDGSMASHRSFNVEAGRLTLKQWKAPGASMIHREGRVTDDRIAELLRVLIERRYWSFPGTRFVPDSPVFLFRFYDGDLEPVDFRCDAAEIEGSPARSAIRDTFLAFVSEIELEDVQPE